MFRCSCPLYEGAHGCFLVVAFNQRAEVSCLLLWGGGWFAADDMSPFSIEL